MEAYIEFMNNMKQFARAEESKAYFSLLKRFQIRMSVMLHDIKPLHDKYVKACMSWNIPKEDEYREKLISWYRKWNDAADAVMHETVMHLCTKVNDRVSFALDACNYRDDPADSLFLHPLGIKSSFHWRMRDDQKGKNLLLSATPYDMFDFYDKVPYSLRPRREGDVLVSAPSAKKPRVVPVYKK